MRTKSKGEPSNVKHISRVKIIVCRPSANHHATTASISSDQSLMLFLSLNMIYDHQSPVKFHVMVTKHVSIACVECRHYFGLWKSKNSRVLNFLYHFFSHKSAGDQ